MDAWPFDGYLIPSKGTERMMRVFVGTLGLRLHGTLGRVTRPLLDQGFISSLGTGRNMSVFVGTLGLRLHGTLGRATRPLLDQGFISSLGTGRMSIMKTKG